jgi:hypothetical protein
VPTVYIKKYLCREPRVSSSNRSKLFLLPYFIFFIAGILSIFHSSAQFMIDDSYIKKFEKENDVEVYTGATKTSFSFRHFANDDISQYKLFANTSAYTGFTIDYNWLSLDFSKNIPNTSVAKQSTSIKAFGIHFP